MKCHHVRPTTCLNAEGGRTPVFHPQPASITILEFVKAEVVENNLQRGMRLQLPNAEEKSRERNDISILWFVRRHNFLSG
jgi:hypothetical protein